MAEQLGLSAEFSADYQQLQNALNSLSRTTQNLDNNIVALGSNLDKSSKQSQGAALELSRLATANEKNSKAVANQATAYERGERARAQTIRAEANLAAEARRGEQAQQRMQRALGGTNERLEQQRYALYDVATTYGAISATLLASSGYAINVGADFESAFTNVQRTSDASQSSLEGLRDSLVDLSTTIPVDFAGISEIATLGNQLGIASQDIAEFTRVVAQFSTVSGMTVDATATAFGALGTLLDLNVDQFNALGSSIAYVARTSVSTEEQIVRLTTELSASARAAGFSAEGIVGLAGTLASLRIPPERARGALDTYFETINKAVAAGGEDLQNFATVTGLAASELDNLIRTGQGDVVFARFLEGLQGADTIEVTQALDELELSQLRVTNTFRRLSQETELYTQLQSAAAQAFQEQAELARQYDIIIDDLNSQFTIFINSLNALVESISGGAIPGLAGLFQVINAGINGLREFIEQNEGLARVARTLLTFGAVIGVMTALRAANALATASTYALVTAQRSLGASNTVGGVRGLVGALVGVDTASRRAATSAAALSATSRSAAGGLVQAGAGGRIAAGGAVAAAGGFRAAAGAALALGRALIVPALITAALEGIAFLASPVESAADNFDDFGSSLSDLGGVSGELDDALGDLGSGLGGAGDSAKDASKEFRTLVDYARDLGDVFGRSFDLRFGGGSALDDIATAFNTVARENEEATQAIQDYRSEIRDLRAEISQLTGDRAIQEYFLSVANAYGDTLRAGAIRGEIAEIDADLAKANEDVAKAQRGANKEQQKLTRSTRGNTQQAIDNRNVLRGLVGNYEDYIVQLAESGASQETIQREIDRSRQEFLAQGEALGFTRSELEEYTAAFNDFSRISSSVSSATTVGFNADPAIQALAEYEAALENARQSTANATGGMGGSFGDLSGGIGSSLEDILSAFDELDLGSLEATDGVKNNFEALLESIITSDWFQPIARWIQANIRYPIAFLLAPLPTLGFQAAEDLIRGFLSSPAVQRVISWVYQNVVNPVANVAGPLLERGRNIANAFFRGLLFVNFNAFQWVYDRVVGPLQNANLPNIMSSIGRALGDGLIGGLTRSIRNVADTVASALRGIGITVTTPGYASGGFVGKTVGRGPKRGYADGGYTGNGAKYAPRGVVHGGEFVFNKAATSAMGVQNLYAMQKAAVSGRGFATGGYVATPSITVAAPSGPGLLELGPSTIRSIVNGINAKPAFFAGTDQQLATRVAAGNRTLSNQGAQF